MLLIYLPDCIMESGQEGRQKGSRRFNNGLSQKGQVKTEPVWSEGQKFFVLASDSANRAIIQSS